MANSNDASSRLSRIVDHVFPSPSLYKQPSGALTTPVTLVRSNPVFGEYQSVKPMKVVVTGAAGNIAYSLLWLIAAGNMLGQNQPIELRLIDIPQAAAQLKGVLMELSDSAFPLVTKYVATTDYEQGFKDVDVAMLVGARPRGPGMQRRDLLQANAAIFKGQGAAMNKFASRNVKTLVVGNPANTNALIALENAPDLPPENFTAMTRLDLNRAKAQIAERLSITVRQVQNVIIWGNHSKTQYPDVNHAIVMDYPHTGLSVPVRSAVADDKWLDGEFISTVQDRGAAVIAARQKSSAASAASSAVDHMHDWFLGTRPGEFTSMAIQSDGSYGIPRGIVYSFPVTINNGKYSIVQGLKIDDFSRKLMDATAKELLDEKKEAGL